MRTWWLLLLLGVGLVGCGPAVAPLAAPVPTLVAEYVPPTAVTLPATPSTTPTAVSTPTPSPLPTSTPTATATATATATLRPTVTATATATAVAPASLTPSATFIPDDARCSPADALARVQPQWVVRPGPWPVPWNRPANMPTLLGRVVNSQTRTLKLLHLGFDVEGDASYIGDLLNVLDRRQVKATMFVLGSWAEMYPDWVQEMARRGHEMASHGYSHQNMAQMTTEQVRDELLRTETAVFNLTGRPVKPWLRPPYGSYTQETLATARESGYVTVIWTGSGEDWRPGMDADKICAAMHQFIVPGAILFAHTGRANIAEAIDRFIGEAQLQGYTLAPLSVLLAEDPAVWLIPAHEVDNEAD